MEAMGTHFIERYIPHRYPFLMVDKVVEVGDGFIEAVKNVSINEAYFQGHYPEEPVMPGVLQVEALAQTGAILAYLTLERSHPTFDKSHSYLTTMDGIKFRRMVRPGDQLQLKVKVLHVSVQNMCRASLQGEAFVDNQLVASVGRLSAIIMQKEPSEPAQKN